MLYKILFMNISQIIWSTHTITFANGMSLKFFLPSLHLCFSEAFGTLMSWDVEN